MRPPPSGSTSKLGKSSAALDDGSIQVVKRCVAVTLEHLHGACAVFGDPEGQEGKPRRRDTALRSLRTTDKERPVGSHAQSAPSARREVPEAVPPTFVRI